MQYYFNTETQACPISMYPSAFANHSAEIFQQIVAHEVFHCVQDWSFPNTSPYGMHKWWLEGTADYFSNLVYPSANREWNRLSSFDYKSINTPIFEMTYENFIFFQFMGNRYSPEGLIDILMRVSAAGGRAAQEAALAAVQGMDVNFNRFVVEYLSAGVLDSGGKRIFSSPTNLTSTKILESEGEVPFDVPPFVAMRYGVYYKEQKRYLQNPINNEGTQFSSVEAKHRRNIGLWSDLPPEIRSECEKEVPYLFVMTTVSNSYTKYDLNVSKAEQASCDPCLLGAWDVDPIKYADMMEAVMNQDAGQEINLLVRQPINSIEGREDIGGIRAIAASPACRECGLSLLLDHAHAQMQGAGLRFSTAVTKRDWVGYQLLQNSGYVDMEVWASAFAKWDAAHQPTRLRAELPGIEGYDFIESLYHNLAGDYLGFACRILPFASMRDRVKLENILVLWENAEPVGYVFFTDTASILKIDLQILRMGIDAGEVIAAVVSKFRAGYIHVELSRPADIASLRSAGWQVIHPAWNAFMLRPLIPEVTIADAKRIFGIGTDQFLISWLDTTW